MTDRIDIPIKACGNCQANYTMAEFLQLALISECPPVEIRECGCGRHLTIDREHLERLDLTATRDQYAEQHPASSRPRDAAPTEPSSPPAAASEPAPEPAKPIAQVVLRAAVRRIATGQSRHASIFLRRIPPEADSATIADLRAALDEKL